MTIAVLEQEPAVVPAHPAFRIAAMRPVIEKSVDRHTSTGSLSDSILATSDDDHSAANIFGRLRWGGQFVFASTRHRLTEAVARDFSANGFELECTPGVVKSARSGWRRILPSQKTHYFVARKTQLIPPGAITERFTYQVELERQNGQYIVSKQVPTVESVVNRLAKRFPAVAPDILEKRAHKFTEKIFPTFLTREASMLQILERDLPKPFDQRVPRLIDFEKDDKGFVRKLRMNWLRNGREPISQLEFARQSAELLHIVHDHAGIIHLDLRLDNVVITDNGVGFVDFGSSVRVGEEVKNNPLLSTLFDELMRTSQIQRMLEKMTLSGRVTSHAIQNGYQKVDKAVDFFYLALQFNSPHANPDLKDLIRYDPESADAKALSRLTAMILKPPVPSEPPFRSARDILDGVLQISNQRQV